MAEPLPDREDLDVVIVGAGLSGIGVACQLERKRPDHRYAIFEGRERLGGTWDLFRYPGIRSDSDMFTLGYPFRPWTDPNPIGDGASILGYIRETAEAFGVTRKIRYRHRIARARWSSEHARWTIEARVTDASGSVETAHVRCKFLVLAAGYYDYDNGYTPELPGRERFGGRILHPQHWPSDLDYTGQKVVVIGSGATAVTLVPAMARSAGHVTMLQRSPTYIVSVPTRDRIGDRLRKLLRPAAASAAIRLKNVLLGTGFYELSRRFPRQTKNFLVGEATKQVGHATDVATHFTPSYNVWDQRLCLIPDNDLWDAIRDKRVSVVTDHIKSFTETGIALESGAHLDADLVVTATGLRLKVFGGVELEVDGARVEPAKVLVYKGMMCSDVPNLAFVTGYTNASWTLKSDLTARFICRLLGHMNEHGYDTCTPRRTRPVAELPLLDFTSGYVQRSIAEFPKQGTERPWRLYQNYALDWLMLEHGRIDDPSMEFVAARR